MKFEIVNIKELDTFIKEKNVFLMRSGHGGQVYSVIGIRAQIQQALEMYPALDVVDVFLTCERKPTTFVDSDGYEAITAGFAIERFKAQVKIL